jgi:Xaa-Pro dipeptidase
MQHASLELLRPGAMWGDVQRAARQLLLQGLLDLGLVKGSVEQLLAAKVDQVFMPHGLGHYLGLDVHDVSGEGPVPSKLLPGHVVTCEPGIYFMELLLQRAAADESKAGLINMDVVQQYMDVGGVRIEDNVLVTEAGHFNITMEASGLAKEAGEVEREMRQ